MAITLSVKVVPSSGRSAFTMDKNGQLKCYLKSQAERGLANDELLQLLSRSLKIIYENIEIIAGRASRKKIIKIQTSKTYNEVVVLLGIKISEKQLSLL